MPHKNFSTRTLSLATAGLCAAAAVAYAVAGSPSSSSLVLADASSEILIEEAGSFAQDGGIEPGVLTVGEGSTLTLADASSQILIESDAPAATAAPSQAVADASQSPSKDRDADKLDSDERTQQLLAALVGGIGESDRRAPRASVKTPKAPARTVSAGVSQQPTRVETAPAVREALSSPEPARKPEIRDPSVRRVARASDDRLASLGSEPSHEAPAVRGSSVTATRSRLQLRQELSPEQIRSAIEAQMPRVRACYERQLKSETDLAGRMVLSMSVQPSGSVSNARIKSDGVGNSALSSCVVKVVGAWNFPKGSEAVAVEYPVVFKPSF